MPRTCFAMLAFAAGAAALVAPQSRIRATSARHAEGPRQGQGTTGVAGISEKAMAGGGFNTEGEPPIQIRGFSLAKATLAAGVLVTGASFYAFFSSGGGAGGASLSSLGFIYGIPILLVGCSLQYAELEPVPVEFQGLSEAAGEALFERKANECMQKIREDVTRHRYGDDAHLDTTTKTLGLAEPGKPFPQLLSIQVAPADDDQMSFSLVFSSKDTPYTTWAEEKRRKKYESFFGPNVDAEVVKVSAERREVAIRLTTNDGAPKKAEAPAAAAPVA
eukprot:CAMPEP_0119272620 /NCGR_PEP_ID=MMETSP1329-20130426/8817_1 /TAXON_ID=114041 /ORGANISM="Genus nov. species nov., Strain RCC1024" /LENGTH=275 /DNA_ID=CAMNT_0007272697 /DNA_START=85 /DNA_END=912 /DNA_ORIENTATION=+